MRPFRILRERWWVVGIAVVVCVVVAFALSSRATKQYTAVAKLDFGQNVLIGEVGGVVTTSANPQADQGTNPQLITTTSVAAAVDRSLGLGTSPANLLAEVSTTNDQSSNIVGVSVVDPVPARAARIANGFANQYVALSRATNLQQVQGAEHLVNQQLQALPPAPANAEARSNLLQALQKLETLAGVQSGDAQVVDYAGVPASPSSPDTKVNALIALVFGLLLGVGVVSLLNLLDRAIKQLEGFEELYGTRALATIPWSDHDGAGGDLGPGSEQFSILRAGLSVLKPRIEPRVVLVTSAVPGEGKTTVAIGLARAAAAAGERVIFVQADVRRASFSSALGSRSGAPGLTTALLRDMDPVALLDSPLPDLTNLRVMTSGPHPHNPVALLGSSRMADVLERLAEPADLVVLDAPPLLPVADTHALLDHPQVDAYLVVGRVGYTKRDEARLARQRLARRDLVNMGLVVNGGHQRAGGYDYHSDPAPINGATVQLHH